MNKTMISKKLITLHLLLVNLCAYSQFSTTAPGTTTPLFTDGTVRIGSTTPINLSPTGFVQAGRLGYYGTYNSAQVQGIWSISNAYPINTTSNNFGAQYGLGYAYSTTGGAPFLNTHQILFTNNGVIGASIGLDGKAFFKGKFGIGVLQATAQLHTINSVRFEGLPFNEEKPSGILGTDLEGNVFNYDPAKFGEGNSASWLLGGNALTTGNEFLGTTTNHDLVFKINNTEKVRLTNNGRLVFYNNNSQTYSNNLYIGGGNEIPSNNAGGVNWGNVSVGLGSMNANTTGNANTALGFNSLASNTSGSGNNTLGANSMKNSVSSSYNVAIGGNSLNGKGNYTENVAIGQNSMARFDDVVLQNISWNTAVGRGSLAYIVSGNNNTALGKNSLIRLNTGNNNIGVGENSGLNFIQGDNNIFIGSNTTPTNDNTSNELNIGNWIYGNNGKIAIGNFTNLPQTFITNNDYQLIVKKGIRTEKVRVDIASVKNWADYVFTKDYQLMPLNELESFITQNKHLPNIPTAEEVVKEGVDLGVMDAKLLEKIEELTLHTIELNKKNESLEEKNESQQKLIDNLVQRLEKLEKSAKQ